MRMKLGFPFFSLDPTIPLPELPSFIVNNNLDVIHEHLEAQSFAELIVLTYKYDGHSMNSVIKKLVSSGKRVTMLIHNEVSMSSWDDIYELLKWIDENDKVKLFSIFITRLDSKAFYPIHHDKGFILLNHDGHYNAFISSGNFSPGGFLGGNLEVLAQLDSQQATIFYEYCQYKLQRYADNKLDTQKWLEFRDLLINSSKAMPRVTMAKFDESSWEFQSINSIVERAANHKLYLFKQSRVDLEKDNAVYFLNYIRNAVKSLYMVCLSIPNGEFKKELIKKRKDGVYIHIISSAFSKNTSEVDELKSNNIIVDVIDAPLVHCRLYISDCAKILVGYCKSNYSTQ